MPARLAAGVLLFALVAACQPRAAPQDPVVTAVRDNDTATLSRYLAEGGDPNARDREGNSLIYVASGPRGGVEVLEALARAGADTEAGTADGRTPLQNAAGWCDVERVLALLDAGADPNATGRGGATALETVCSAPADRRAEVLAILESAMR